LSYNRLTDHPSLFFSTFDFNSSLLVEYGGLENGAELCKIFDKQTFTKVNVDKQK
jgi:hypothetical protein